MRRIYLGLVILLLSPSLFAENSFPVKARLFVGAISADPKDVNTELTAQALEKIDNVYQIGAEATYSVSKFLDTGLRYTKRYADSGENPANPATDYKATLNSDTVYGIVRIPFINGDFVRMDIFGGAGPTKTSLKMKTAGVDGELTKSASLAYAYGASVAFGYKKFFFVIEGGYEANKIESLSKSGTINGNISTIDLTGPYLSVGILFDSMASKAK